MSKVRPLIAIVDDEESIRRALKRLMLSADFDVETFASGVEFLDSLRSRCPACVVLDLHMPGLSGFDVQAKLAQAGQNVPVIVITGHDTPQSRERVLTAGTSAYLRKPVDEKVLLDALRIAIASGSGGP